MPITSSSAMTTITAAMAAPAIFNALISIFQQHRVDRKRTRYRSGNLIPERDKAQSSQK